MAKPLLPKYQPGTNNEATDFGAGESSSGVSSINPDAALRDLIWKQGLRAEGVSHCLAAAEAFRWRLELGSTQDAEARRALEFLLQCQFLGFIDTRRISLDRTSLLKQVVSEAAGESETVIWSLNCVSTKGQALVGGRLGRRYVLFPSASLQEDPRRIGELAEIIMTASAGAVRLEHQRLEFVDAEQARRFRRTIGGCPSSC